SLSLRQNADPNVRPFLNAFPLPNGAATPDGMAALAAGYSNPSTLNATSIRIDHVINQRVTLFGRYNYAPSDTVARDSVGLSTLQTTTVKTHTLTLGFTWSITPRVINETRFNYSHNRAATVETLDNFGGAVALTDTSVF